MTSQQEFTSCLKETLSGPAKNATDLQVRGKMGNHMGPTHRDFHRQSLKRQTLLGVISSLFLLILLQACLNSSFPPEKLVSVLKVVYLLISLLFFLEFWHVKNELTKAMEGLGMDEGWGRDHPPHHAEYQVQNPLSKDVLYPSLKEITEKVCELLFMLFLLIPHCINSHGLLCLFRNCKDRVTQVYRFNLFFFPLCLFILKGRVREELCLQENKATLLRIFKVEGEILQLIVFCKLV